MKKTRRAAATGLTLLVTAAALAACGEAPEESGSGNEASGSDFKPCIVSDQGGFDDKSFNQLGFEGATRAAEEEGVELTAVESNNANDYGPNMESLVAEGCTAIVSVGFELADATKEYANANPEIDFVLIDNDADGGEDGQTYDGEADAPNIKPLLYNTAEAAFLAGYLSADFSETGKVGTYGGAPIPTVTVFMDGFRQGVEYYNEQKGAEVEVVGWDGQDGSFTGSFEAGPGATETARQILAQDVDVILPVGGPIYQGALTAINDQFGDAVLIGTDADVFESDPSTQDVILTSIRKNMADSTYEALVQSAEGELEFEPYVGTLENDGVSIAPLHNFEGEVSDTVMAEIDEIRQGIIDGEITVESYLQQ